MQRSGHTFKGGDRVTTDQIDGPTMVVRRIGRYEFDNTRDVECFWWTKAFDGFGQNLNWQYHSAWFNPHTLRHADAAT